VYSTARSKGRVESGIKYLRHNFWPGARFVDDADLNRLAQAWVDGIANQRMHGTTHERPVERLARERPTLGSLPGPERLTPFLREDRRVGRDGYVQWERAWYGVRWPWAGKLVQVQGDDRAVQIWAGDERLAVHPRATHPGQRFTLPGQWQAWSMVSNGPLGKDWRSNSRAFRWRPAHLPSMKRSLEPQRDRPGPGA
jgi:Mu transposase, C-terminal domain